MRRPRCQDAGETPALPGSGRLARAARMRVRRPRSQEAGETLALPGSGRDARAPRKRVRRSRSQEAGETPALPGSGRDACAPRMRVRRLRSQEAGETPALPGCGRDARAARMRVRRPRCQDAGETPALPGCGRDARAARRDRVSDNVIFILRAEGLWLFSTQSPRARAVRLRPGSRGLQPDGVRRGFARRQSRALIGRTTIACRLCQPAGFAWLGHGAAVPRRSSPPCSSSICYVHSSR